MNGINTFRTQICDMFNADEGFIKGTDLVSRATSLLYTEYRHLADSVDVLEEIDLLVLEGKLKQVEYTNPHAMPDRLRSIYFIGKVELTDSTRIGLSILNRIKRLITHT